MPRKLFVGGLSWGTDDQALRAAFESYGTIEEAVVITDRETGQSRGFGFVTYADEDAAVAAQQAMDGGEIDGRRVRIDFAREQSGGRRSGPGGGGGGGYGGGGGRGGGGGGYGGGRGGGGGGYGGGGGRGGGGGGYGGGGGGRRGDYDDEPSDRSQRGTKRW